MPLKSGLVFGHPVNDSAWRFPVQSRVVRYEIGQLRRSRRALRLLSRGRRAAADTRDRIRTHR